MYMYISLSPAQLVGDAVALRWTRCERVSKNYT